jgi:microcystin degradation protein MlrC
MRIGVLALLHESNTFLSQLTDVENFRQNLLLTGEPIRTALADAHHEVGGFFAGLKKHQLEAIPIFAARALPSGTISATAFEQLVSELLIQLAAAGPLDGVLAAPHGATVSEEFPDADGYWLSRVREAIGPNIPLIGTLDAHANLSPLMVASCDALVAYRTNPHLDQRERGLEAAELMARTVKQKIRPVMAAAFPTMAISIERQCTDEPHLKPLYEFADQQLSKAGVLSNSILLGFPYSDVAEMGSSVIVVTDNDPELARQSATDMAQAMWDQRHELHGEFTSVAEAILECQQAIANSEQRICLLDMGDNVGGGSAADGTELLAALHQQTVGPACGCLYDPDAVQACVQAGVGSPLNLLVGGKTDALHGPPFEFYGTVVSIHEGKFSEPQPRHGGITDFDQGQTAVVTSDSGLTLLLTSRRMVPFSLQQLISCNVDPAAFRILVAKGVNAPIAAYREVCDRFLRVNTIGSTCADMRRLTYKHRRTPLFPLESQAEFTNPTVTISDFSKGIQ